MAYAKKYLGQHFLKNETIAREIAHSLSESGYQCVVEVGAGYGMLTKYLLNRSFRFIAIETDASLIPVLHRQFPALELIHGNFLKLDLYKYTDDEPFALIGNYPYNISSQILFKMLEYRSYAIELVGMFQKEVAERIISGPGKKSYGVISVLIQAYYKGEYLFTVEPSNFNPPPKVRSAVIRLKRKTDRHLGCNSELFRKIVKTSFNQRRKMLRNTLKPLVGDSEVLKDELFNLRPERLSVRDFVDLTNRIDKLNNSNYEPH